EIRRLRVARGAQHPHPETLRAVRDRLADPAVADDPERRSVDVGAEVPARLPRAPIALAHRRVGLGELPRRRHQQRERQVSGRVGQHVRGVADRDLPGGGPDSYRSGAKRRYAAMSAGAPWAASPARRGIRGSPNTAITAPAAANAAATTNAMWKPLVSAACTVCVVR